MWIEREISASLLSRKALGILALVGVRQAGKSALLRRADPNRRWVSLDDIGLRDLANQDPDLLLRTHPPPLIVDECQLAPPLFPALKRLVDDRRAAGLRDTAVWLTGSHQLLIDSRIKESLAGRTTFRTLHPLSISELASAGLQAGALFRGGFPELVWDSAPSPVDYFDAYLRTVVERDVVLAAGITKTTPFTRLVRLLALRVGNLLNLSELARDAAVAVSTASDWVSALERMGLVHLVSPMAPSLSSRLVKTPKVFLCDTGLAARLQGWTTPEQLSASPQVGALFENQVLLEVMKARDHHGLPWSIHHWRTRDGEEVDLIVESTPGRRVALECKWTRPRSRHLERPRALAHALGDIPFWVVSELGPTALRTDGTGFVGLDDLSRTLRDALDG
ncbi:MAG TPA: ATP-binding protein [Myxococcota bacterium]|nr:ATP-binding protein [Myxococcota bacterium]